MEVGISTACLYPMETERSLELLCARGVRMVELFINAPCETTPASVRDFARIARGAGVSICSVHPYSSVLEPFFFFSDYRRRFEDALLLYEGFYHAANELGAKIVCMHGDRRGGKLEDKTYYERFGELALHAKKFGITLAQENVAYCRSGDAAFVRAMRAYLGGEARFVLDLKQTVRAGGTALEMLEAMGEQVVHLHLSDHNGAGQDCLPPGEGCFDFPAFWARLRELGYKGAGVVELYQENYRDMDQLLQSTSWLQEQFL